MVEKPFLIVCAASSGSTLLSVLLDKHPDLAIGPELAVFNKKVTFESFNKYKSNISKYFKKGAPSLGQVEYSGYFDNLSSYFWSQNELKELAKSVSCHRDFFDLFFGRFLEKRQKKVWGEKTGSNAYYLPQFLDLYPNAKIIHLTRHPYDAINSVIKRTVQETSKNKKEAIYHATSHWLYNNAASYRIQNKSNYMQVSYENLITNTQKTLIEILNFLEVPFHDLIEVNNNNSYWESKVDRNNTHRSWTSSPFEKISSDSIGKGKAELPLTAIDLILKLKLSPFAQSKLNINEEINIIGLAKKLGYLDVDKINLFDTDNASSENSLNGFPKYEIIKYQSKRMIRDYIKHKAIYIPLFI